jgi:hypothetical protein
MTGETNAGKIAETIATTAVKTGAMTTTEGL